jgi:tight adherence protein B
MAQLIGMGFGLGFWFVVLSVWPNLKKPIQRAPKRVTLDWPTFIDDVASGVRSGLTLPSATFEAGKRLPDVAAKIFKNTEEVWREVGGYENTLSVLSLRFTEPGGNNTPTVLSQLARSLRARKQLENDIAARQATTINSAKVALAAPLLVLLLTSARPEVRSAYSNPTGFLVLVGIVAISIGSYRLMIRTAKLPELEFIR